MGSRKEEERNEKIIRGLMKLPPNRRCINCNSLGPQYVCTNFWTFVCMTCSGIHREFTHRVKSVSMAKFTSQEVEALQNGGNQRAREIYMKDWDLQRQRLPDSSYVEKVREFIRNVYVDRRYAGGKTSDKLPKDLQNHEDDTRRASSYHSYSQSPPYDYQYEDRRYGKQAAALTRRPGSDRGLYAGKISSFVYSPGGYEDRFANEGSVSRVSDYSASSAGDPGRSGTESPNSQKDFGFGSPPIHSSRDVLGEDVHQAVNLSSRANCKRDGERIPRPQRNRSSGSIGSIDSNSTSFKSHSSGNLMDAVSETEQTAGTHQDKMFTSPQPAVSASYGGLDLFETQVGPELNSSTASSIDLFQLPVTSSAQSVDLFQQSTITLAPSMNSYLPPQTSPPASVDLFAGTAQQQSATHLDEKSAELSMPKNEGWATFDNLQPMASTPATDNFVPGTTILSSGGSLAKFDAFPALNTSIQWPSFQNSGAYGSSSLSDLWHKGSTNVHTPANATNNQSWNAFDDSIRHLPLEGIKPSSEPQIAAYKPSASPDQFLGLEVSEDSNADGVQRAASYVGPSGPSLPSHLVMGTSSNPLMLPSVGDAQSTITPDRKSTNPFDLPFDSDLERSNMFLDMSSLQASLPNAHLPSTFLGGVSQPWFPQDPVTAYIPAAPQGGLAYMTAQAPSTQLPNVQTQGPVASVGGNPFA